MHAVREATEERSVKRERSERGSRGALTSPELADFEHDDPFMALKLKGSRLLMKKRMKSFEDLGNVLRPIGWWIGLQVSVPIRSWMQDRYCGYDHPSKIRHLYREASV